MYKNYVEAVMQYRKACEIKGLVPQPFRTFTNGEIFTPPLYEFPIGTDVVVQSLVTGIIAASQCLLSADANTSKLAMMLSSQSDALAANTNIPPYKFKVDTTNGVLTAHIFLGAASVNVVPVDGFIVLTDCECDLFYKIVESNPNLFAAPSYTLSRKNLAPIEDLVSAFTIQILLRTNQILMI